MRRVIFFLGVLFLAQVSFSATIHVPSDQPTIQAGIDAAVNGDTVLVAAGTYDEQFSFRSKTIAVISQNGPSVTKVLGSTISNPDYPTVLIENNVGSEAVLQGFTFDGGPIAIRANGNATIRRNILTDQTYVSWAALVAYGQTTIINNTICYGANGALACYNSNAIIINNVITFNNHYGIHGLVEGTYNDVYGNTTDYQDATAGVGSISTDPLFIDMANRDYNLSDESPCIDAGDPDPQYNDPDGSRNDMGAYPYNQHTPTTLIVPDQYATIQEAVDSALAGDTILIRDGIYNESVSIISKAIYIISENGKDASYLVCDTARCLTIDGSESLEIVGISISGQSDGYGGAVMIANSDITIYDCRIYESSGIAYGGGIYAEAAIVRIGKCTIEDNYVGGPSQVFGGGIYCDGLLRVDSSYIANNTAFGLTMQGGYGRNDGGGIYSIGDNTRITNSIISSNECHSNGQGGGIYLNGNDFLVENCEITGNSMGGNSRYAEDVAGGGLCAYGNFGKIAFCRIDHNIANSRGWYGFNTSFGGGIYIAGADTIFSNLVYSNTAGVYSTTNWNNYLRVHGGGIYSNNGAVVKNNTVVQNNTVALWLEAGSSMDSKGGGCYVSGGLVENNIISYNGVTCVCENLEYQEICNPSVAGSGAYIGAATSLCNVYFGNIGADEWSGDTGLNNFCQNPYFCNAPDNSYAIMDISPCVPENNVCETLIGAFEIGCTGKPIITDHGILNEEAEHVIGNTPSFWWGYQCPLDNPEDSFTIAVGTDDDWQYAEMWNPAPFAGPDTSVVYSGAALIDGETYYLRLRVHNGLAWSEWYELSFRMNSVPSVPEASSPVEDMIVNDAHPMLYLQNSTDAEGDMLAYEYAVYSDPETLITSSEAIEQEVDSTGWMVDIALDDNTQFFWNVRAGDGYEFSDWCELQSFWVNGSENFPTTFDLIWPPDTGWSQVCDFPTPFAWQSSDDPDPMDSVHYKLQISTDSAFTFVATYDSIYQTTHEVPALNYDDHYWWRVYAIDTKGNSTACNGVADFLTWVLGDANQDGACNVGDAVFLINFIFKGGAFPEPFKVGDVNGDCEVNVADAVYMISFVFKGGPPPQVGCAVYPPPPMR